MGLRSRRSQQKPITCLKVDHFSGSCERTRPGVSAGSVAKHKATGQTLTLMQTTCSSTVVNLRCAAPRDLMPRQASQGAVWRGCFPADHTGSSIPLAHDRCRTTHPGLFSQEPRDAAAFERFLMPGLLTNGSVRRLTAFLAAAWLARRN
jgi:hypothetical protein